MNQINAANKKLTPVELAETMIEYSKKLKELRDLEALIKETVLDLGKTQTVGDIRATYSAGRGSYDYETAATSKITADKLAELKRAYSKTVYDWRAICRMENVEMAPFYQSTAGPSVSIRFIR